MSAREAVARLRLIPVMFEQGASPHLARHLYRAYIEQSHIFIGIYGTQYGWMGPGMEISGLEDEYNEAARKPRFIYIQSNAVGRDPRLQKMLQRIRDLDGIAYKYFNGASELRELIENDISRFLSEQFEVAAGTGGAPARIMSGGNLPVPISSLVGREKEMESLRRLILEKEYRLITLTGTGGSGKTRLSLEVAYSCREAFDEIYFVELAALVDPKLVPSTIARTMGLRESGTWTPEEQLLEYARQKSILFILDNFEQILDASHIVVKLLECSAGISILVTSRIALRIRGETEVSVPPLEIPDLTDPGGIESLMQTSSVDLFIRRALAVNKELKLTSENARIIGEICARLDGLPLAIELAAVRTRILTPHLILERLRNSIPVLTNAPRDLPERHQTMQRAIEWSYNLLDADSQTLFRRLAAFAGGFTVDAAERICNIDGLNRSAIAASLESLIEINLLRLREQASGMIRLSMLETIREFAGERLAAAHESELFERRHAEYYLELVKTTEPNFRSGMRNERLTEIETEIDNIRIVLGRSLSRRISPDFGIQLVGYLGWFFHLRGHLKEGREWAGSMLSLPQAAGHTEMRARALFPAGGLAWSQSDYKAAVDFLEESVSIFRELGDRYWQIQAQVLLAGSYAGLRQYDKGYLLSGECVQIAREIGDLWGEAYSLYWLGDILFLKTADPVASIRLYEDSLKIFSELKDPWGVAEARGHIGVIAAYQGDSEIAQSNLEMSLTVMERIGDRWAVARGYSGLGDIYLHRGQYGQAADYYKRSMHLWKELGNTPGIMMSLTGLARIADATDRPKLAALLIGKIEQPFIVVGILILPVDPHEYEKFKAKVSTSMSEADWAAEIERGRLMTFDEIIELVVSEDLPSE